MRALILVATAALALSACSREEAANNVMNVDETLTTNEVVTDNTLDANMTMDANMDMNADVNAVDNAATNNAL